MLRLYETPELRRQYLRVLHEDMGCPDMPEDDEDTTDEEDDANQ